MIPNVDPAKEAARLYLQNANRLEAMALQESSRNRPLKARELTADARRLRKAARAELQPGPAA